jgi:hypothetical protein
MPVTKTRGEEAGVLVIALADTGVRDHELRQVDPHLFQVERRKVT